MISSIQKLFSFHLKDESHLCDLITEDGFCSFYLKFETVDDVRAMMQSVLSIQHEKNLAIHLKIVSTSLYVRIEHQSDVDHGIINELINSILEQERKIKRG